MFSLNVSSSESSPVITLFKLTFLLFFLNYHPVYLLHNIIYDKWFCSSAHEFTLCPTNPEALWSLGLSVSSKSSTALDNASHKTNINKWIVCINQLMCLYNYYNIEICTFHINVILFCYGNSSISNNLRFNFYMFERQKPRQNYYRTGKIY